MSDPKPVRVAAVQMDPRIGEVGANLEAILDHFREATAARARLVVFPECALTGYMFDSREESTRHAETIPGPSSRRVASACAEADAFAIFGLLERDGDRLYNACVLVGPRGVVGSYRKVHIPFMGVDRFVDPGDRPFEVLEIEGLRVGMHICYDGAFPEAGRVLTLLGADVLVLPTNWPVQALTIAEHLPAARAIENVVYFVAVDRVGEERGCRFLGSSSIADPGGVTLAKAGLETEEILYADVDPAISRRKRLVRIAGRQEIDRIADRRPGFYGPLAGPNGRD